MTQPTPDPLRAALSGLIERAYVAVALFDSLGDYESEQWAEDARQWVADVRDYMRPLNTALAAAPQPAPADRDCLCEGTGIDVKCPDRVTVCSQCGGEGRSHVETDQEVLLTSGLYLDPTGYPKPQPIHAVLSRQASQENCDGEPYDAMVFAAAYIKRLEDALLAAGWTRGGAEAGLRDGLEAACDLQNWIEDNVSNDLFDKIPVNMWGRITNAIMQSRAALARPSAPETSLDAILRAEAKQIGALDELAVLGQECDKTAPETLAWAVVDPVAGIRSAFFWHPAALKDANESDSIKRVAIRVVEDGGD